MIRVATGDIFDVSFFRDGVIAEGFTEIDCLMKHFVNGSEVERRSASLSLAGRNVSARDLNVRQLDRAGGVVQILWTVRFQMAFTPVGMVTGDGSLPLSFEYSAAEGRNPPTITAARRSGALPRTRGIYQVSFNVDTPEGRVSGDVLTFSTAFEMSFARSSSGASVSVAGVSAGGASSSSTTSLMCSARARGNIPRG